jgi:hypothetical protein
MLITLYTPIGIVYQTFNINENDIIYNDLIKYINLPKHELYDELNELKQFDLSTTIKFTKVFVKTIINLFTYENGKNSEKINLDNEILSDSYEFTILFNYEYYIYKNGYGLFLIENNIKNYNNIIDEIKNDPYQIIFIENNDENYYEICKLAVQQDGYTLQCIKNQTDEICKLAVKTHGGSLQFVNKELITDEICKLAVQQDGCTLKCIKNQTDEICKLALKTHGGSLQFVNQELMTDEICKLAVSKTGIALQFVNQELMTDEIL